MEHTTTRTFTIGYPYAGFIDPRNEDILYMGGPQNAPLVWGAQRSANSTFMCSLDGGTTWTERRNGLPTTIVGNIEAMGMHHNGESLMLTAGTATGEVFVSDDAGETWSTAASGLPPISKGGHYRWFLAAAQRASVEEAMRASV